MTTIAALFVVTDGCYFGLDGVDPWDIVRDARKYDGPHPVVAHPPCQRWGRYWGGGPSAKTPRKLGDDDGCFESALASVRRFGLTHPLRGGGWSVAGDDIGWTCCVEQGAYGHRARKATWLYAVGTELPTLTWKAAGTFSRLDAGFHSAAERAAAGPIRNPVKRLTERECLATPEPFRDLLISIARSSRARALATWDASAVACGWRGEVP